MGNLRIWISILIIALVTAALRFLPFIVFGGKRKVPVLIERLGKTLPFAVMGMLVVYCLKDVSFTSITAPLPALISCAVVCLLHVWRRNTLLSIISGTLCYMILTQLVF